MVVDTLGNGTANATGRGKAKEILADAAAIATYKDGSKNVPMNVTVIPKLYGHAIERLAADPANLETADGKTTVKRSVYSNAIRVAIAHYFEYPFEKVGELMIPNQRGTAGLVNMFKSTVQSMFELARSIGQLANLNEDQVKELAFAKAKDSVTSHPQLNGIEITDELLDVLWNGGDIGTEDDDDDDGEDGEDENATPNQPVATAPAFG